MSKFLFVHFTDNINDGEQVYFSVSSDGLHYEDLNNEKPVLISEVGTKGVRDPFIIKDEKIDKYFIIATDLNISVSRDWEQAIKKGSKDLIIWESNNLIDWSAPRLVNIAPENAGNVWAPEAIFDEEKNEFLIFWASYVDGKHKIYASYTPNFYEFSEAFVFLEAPSDVIDTTIIHDKGIYYRFSKDETTSRIVLDKSDSLMAEFVKIDSSALEKLNGVEGPQVYRLPNKGFCLIVDQFKEQNGYMPLLASDLASGIFKEVAFNAYDFGKLKKRHGSVIQISDEEYERLVKNFHRELPVIEGLFADPDLVKYENNYYIFATTDGKENWNSSTLSVFESTNLATFSKQYPLLDLATEQVPWTIGNAWAPCVTKRNGKFYYYFCGRRLDGRMCIGMATSKNITGPYEAMKEPLLTPEILQDSGIEISQVIDPSIYIEDGRYYMLFGNGKAVICELANDMNSIEDNKFFVYDNLPEFREAITVFKKGDVYHFSWSCDDTNSENYHINYGISDSLFGSIDFQYTLLQKNTAKNILGTGHHSILQDSATDNYYIAYHRFARPVDKYFGKNGFNREICITQLHFNSKGLLERVIL